MNIKELIKTYQPYLYNLALRLVYYPEDAKDLTQDVWIKVLNSLDGFEQKSDFKTWVYRIMMNEFLNQKRKTRELSFSDFSETMNNMENCLLGDEYDEPEKSLLINEAKVRCMLGMLLCLDKEQRAILVIGDIFEIKSDVASKIFGITKENFRKKLSRARADLYNFMNNHCSLVNAKNACKCEQKTKALIENGYVDQNSIQFNPIIQKNIQDKLQILSEDLDTTMETLYKNLYQSHPFITIDENQFANDILKNPRIKEIFDF